MQFLRAGYVDGWSSYQQVRYVGAGGGFWSSAAAGGADARYLGFIPTDVRPSYGDPRAYGFSLRCLVLPSAS